MEPLFAGIVILGFAAIVVVLYVTLGKPRPAEAELKGALQQLTTQTSNQFTEFQRVVDRRIVDLQSQWQDQNRTIGDRLKESGDALRSVSENLGQLSEAAKKIEEQAANVLRLEDLLKPQKVRGNLGQTLMVAALRQVLPESAFTAPYRFPDGLEVDAAIFLAGKIVPIDSKFPLENYRRAMEGPDELERRRARRQFSADVKKHIDAIASKYIRPADGTFEFALMYIPAEAVYVEMLADTEDGGVVDYAMRLNVTPVSPHLLFAYLHTIALGLQGLEINAKAQEIVERIAVLSREWAQVEVPFTVLGRHLTHAQNKYQDASAAVNRFGGRLRSVSGVEIPQTDELLAEPLISLDAEVAANGEPEIKFT